MSEELKAAQARIACLEGEIAKRDEELAACRVAVENCDLFRARIAEIEADRDSHQRFAIQAMAELAALKAQEPVQVDCVAVMRADGDGGLEVEWLLEGGTAELMSGMYLCCVGGGTLLFEEGSGHLYAAPVSEAKEQGVVMPEPDIKTAHGYPAYSVAAVTALIARINAAPVQQDQAFCEYCGGNDEEPQDHCMDCTRPVQQVSALVHWTGCHDADIALNLLDRIDAPDDEDRISQLEQIVMRMGKQFVNSAMLAAPAAPAADASALADAFLSWKLPNSVRPDGCAMDPTYPHRYGTNLMTWAQAKEMFEYVLVAHRAKGVV